MAVPSGYTIALTINTLGVVGNVLGVNTTLYQCPTCRATTLDPNAHDAWHASNVAAIKSAADTAAAAKTAADTATTTAKGAATTAGTAASDAAAAKTTAAGAATTAGQAQQVANQAASDAGAAKTTAGNASSAAGQALTTAQQADQMAEQANTVAQLAVPGSEVTLCPLCRATVRTDDLRVHLTYHYRRAHGDPVEFPEDFDPTTQDMAQVDPPMRVANKG